MLKCVVLSVFVCICLAQSPVPPVVKFINGQFTGTLQTQGLNVPLTGSLEYLPGSTQNIKTHVVASTGGQQITTDTWETVTSTVINSWEITSVDPTTCQSQSLSGSTYPQCGQWAQKGNSWTLECSVNIQGVTAIIDILAIVNSGNQLVQLQENTTVQGELLTSEILQINSQTTTPPPASDFKLPSICNSATATVSPRLHVRRQPRIFHSIAGALGNLFNARAPLRRN